VIDRTPRRRWSGVVAVVVAVLAFPTASLAQDAPFTVAIKDLVPGVTQSTSFTYYLAKDAVFHGLTWTLQTGALEIADLTVEVCHPAGVCVISGDRNDDILPAGYVKVTVTASLNEAAAQNSSGTAAGELVFVAADESDNKGLPLT